MVDLLSHLKNQTLNGAYGGKGGRPVVPGNHFVLYGFYNIPVCPQSPLIIRYESGSPVHAGPVDRFRIINCNLFNRELGAGVAQGVFRVTSVGNNQVHFAICNLVTFLCTRISSQCESFQEISS